MLIDAFLSCVGRDTCKFHLTDEMKTPHHICYICCTFFPPLFPPLRLSVMPLAKRPSVVAHLKAQKGKGGAPTPPLAPSTAPRNKGTYVLESLRTF